MRKYDFLTNIILALGHVAEVIMLMMYLFGRDTLLGTAFIQFLCLDLVIAVHYVIAAWFYSIAVEKGYDNIAFFRFAFWCALAGYLMIIALPDRGVRNQPYFNELPEL